MFDPGARLDVSLRFTQAQFDEFARLSGDDNPIHVDPEFCAGTRFGRPVAHGMMLFGMLEAAVCRWIELPVTVWAQELTFRAPTFADEDVTATLTVEAVDERCVRIAQWIHRSDGAETAAGHTIVGLADVPPAGGGAAEPPPTLAEELFGIRPGMEANARRTISAGDVKAYLHLIDNPNPRYGAGGSIPPPLIGGLVSHLLGVELPGRGTNWLRQRYTFPTAVPVDSTIETRVEVTRVRPDKALVNLATTCVAGGRTVVTGDALVLIADLEHGGVGRR